MAHSLVEPRIVTPSLLRAAEDLQEVSGRADGPEWVAKALSAIRTAITAVEAELGSLGGSEGVGEQIIEAQPRLSHALEALEADLAWTLVALWKIKERMRRGHGIEDLSHLALHISRTAQRVFQLVHESLEDPAAMD